MKIQPRVPWDTPWNITSGLDVLIWHEKGDSNVSHVLRRGWAWDSSHRGYVNVTMMFQTESNQVIIFATLMSVSFYACLRSFVICNTAATFWMGGLRHGKACTFPVSRVCVPTRFRLWMEGWGFGKIFKLPASQYYGESEQIQVFLKEGECLIRNEYRTLHKTILVWKNIIFLAMSTSQHQLLHFPSTGLAIWKTWRVCRVEKHVILM